MRVLVAGGAGFIGSHLCDRIYAEGASILCVDNLLTGLQANIGQLLDRPEFTFRQHDVTQPLEAEVDAIFHLASPASPNPASVKSYLAHPIETALVNSQGTYNLLELARRTGARLVFASTSEVYGDPLEHPQREAYWGNVDPTGMRSCYDESKRFGEALSMAFARRHGVDVRIARIFNTYGPRCDSTDGRVVPNFVSQALSGNPITVFGDGSQTRSLCYVSDLVDGLWRMMMAEEARGEVFNLGNLEEHSVIEYALMIRDLCGSTSEIVHEPLPAGDPTRRRPDISKAARALGWEPKVFLADGLTRTIAWYREQLGRGAAAFSAGVGR
ncbi:MAG: NAD-dependent epimerase/dehydratase family protein [Chloroflexi bacterium]|nr:NAD-dependent epimerase/dehydratase family protein [Chloroflexota bacterium]